MRPIKSCKPITKKGCIVSVESIGDNTIYTYANGTKIDVPNTSTWTGVSNKPTLTQNGGNVSGTIDLESETFTLNTIHLSNEQVEDIVGNLFNSGTHTNATVNYDDNGNAISISVAARTEEEIQDIVGRMFPNYDDDNGLIILEKYPLVNIEEGGNTGYGTQYRRDNFHLYGNIGEQAIDLSFSTSLSSTKGATGKRAYTQGTNTTASGNHSHAEGIKTIASGDDGSHAEGFETEASGNSAHSEGRYSEASGYVSHSEGANTTASGARSHAQNWYTIASGQNSHAEGRDTEASAEEAHAQGRGTLAAGKRSFTQGYYTIALANNESARGIFNQSIDPSVETNSNNQLVESVGGGIDQDNRLNLMARFNSGAFYYNKLTDFTTAVTNAAEGFHAADATGRLNYFDTEWSPYMTEKTLRNLPTSDGTGITVGELYFDSTTGALTKKL